MHPWCFLDLPERLPDFWEGHVGVNILKPGFVATFHVSQLGKEQFLLSFS